MGSRYEVNRGQWSSRWIFILAATGSAVGLGNIWRFPYVTGENGGGAFVLIYLACVVLVGVPIMMAEILLGRRGRSSPINAVALLAKREGVHPSWSVIGWMGVLAGFLILSFYAVVAGWSLAYVSYAAQGLFEGTTVISSKQAFDELTGSAGRMLFWHSLFMGMTMFVIARGVNDGLEQAIKFLMPALFILLVVMVCYAAATGDVTSALRYLFQPDFSKITRETVMTALGQAFFSLSLGMGAIMIYGSYLPNDAPIPGTSFLIAGVDTVVALLAGVAVFPIVFGYGLEPGEGPGLVFITLTMAFGHMSGGKLFGMLFFILLSIAAWTSAISVLEPVVAWLAESVRWSRVRACLISGFCAWFLGLGSLLSFNEWSSFRPGGRNFFEWAEFLSTTVLLPLGGMLIAIFAGWRMRSVSTMDELGTGDSGVYRVWQVLVRYVAPVGVGIVFAQKMISAVG